MVFWAIQSAWLLHAKSNTVPGSKGCGLNKKIPIFVFCMVRARNFSLARFLNHWGRLGFTVCLRLAGTPTTELISLYSHCSFQQDTCWFQKLRNFSGLNVIWKDQFFQTRGKCIWFTLKGKIPIRFFNFLGYFCLIDYFGAIGTFCLHQHQKKMRFFQYKCKYCLFHQGKQCNLI